MYPWVGRLEQDARRSTEELSENVTGYGTNLFVQTTQSSITIGGGGSGIGLFLDELLVKGETGHCKTFDNDPLTGNKTKTFDIHTVEVFAFRE
jgi:hypothetical protein